MIELREEIIENVVDQRAVEHRDIVERENIATELKEGYSIEQKQGTEKDKNCETFFEPKDKGKTPKSQDNYKITIGHKEKNKNNLEQKNSTENKKKLEQNNSKEIQIGSIRDSCSSRKPLSLIARQKDFRNLFINLRKKLILLYKKNMETDVGVNVIAVGMFLSGFPFFGFRVPICYFSGFCLFSHFFPVFHRFLIFGFSLIAYPSL